MNRSITGWILCCSVGAALAVRLAQAHHSLAPVYDTTQQVSLEGVITHFHFVNPHPYLTLEVRPESAEAQQWRLEMDNRRELVEVGMDEQTLKAGDRVLVKGNPIRDGSRALYIRVLDRPSDGFQYSQPGSSPQVRRGR